MEILCQWEKYIGRADLNGLLEYKTVPLYTGDKNTYIVVLDWEKDKALIIGGQ
jgi:hypothetical protein